MDLPELQGRADAVRARIEAARARAGRRAPVTLLAVTKTHPAETVKLARRAGLTDLGENRVQELEAKVAAVGRDGLRWHLIGTLQRNKVRRALPLFDLFHALDSLRLAEALSQEAVRAGGEVSALLEVNVSGEASKSGFAGEQAIEALARIGELPGLRMTGLMTMAPFTDDAAVLRRVFAAARRLWEDAARQVPTFRAEHLSMGMSNDYEIAVEEGSTLVRLGTALFGEREA